MNDNRLTVLSSKTDLDGLYGKPEIFTEWGTDNETPVLRDVRWPGPQAGDLLPSPDAKPCEHYFWTTGEEK